MQNAPHIYAKDRDILWQWLLDNHQSLPSAWIVYDRGKNSQLSYNDIVEVCLCFGWIDSRPGKVSDTQTKLYISKRKPKSAWSKSNKIRVQALTKSKSIQPAGQAAIDIAKANGAWDALNKSDAFEIPLEMIELFKKYPLAKKNYESFSASSKRIILEWIYSAKKQETKMKRIEQTVTLAQKGIKAHHQ